MHGGRPGVLEHPRPHDEDRKEYHTPQRCANVLRGKETIDVILLLSFVVHSSYHFSARSNISDSTSTGIGDNAFCLLHPILSAQWLENRHLARCVLRSEKIFCMLSLRPLMLSSVPRKWTSCKAQVHPSTNCDRYNAHIYSMPFEDGSTTMVYSLNLQKFARS